MIGAEVIGADVIGVVLAGGKGSRLGGVDKGLCLLHARPLVAHVLDALRRQLTDVLIVANRNQPDYARFAPVISDENDDYAGPIAGLAAAFAEAGNRWVLSVPVDCPRPPTSLLSRLLATMHANPDLSCAAAHDGVRAQPLFALYRPGLVQAARQAALQQAPMWRWQQSLGAATVDFSDTLEAFANLNTQADFEAFERHHDPA